MLRHGNPVARPEDEVMSGLVRRSTKEKRQLQKQVRCDARDATARGAPPMEEAMEEAPLRLPNAVSLVCIAPSIDSPPQSMVL